MDNRIIVIDDEQDFLDSIRRGLITSGFKNIHIEDNPEKAAAAFKTGETFDIALIDITMPGMDGMELLEVIRNNSPRTECIMVTAIDEVRVAIKCLRKGAYDYLVKPLSKEDLISSLNRALERKRLVDLLDLGKLKSIPQLENKEAFRPIITRSEKVLRVLKEAELHASGDVPILITGDTGTGKELLSRAIHAASPRVKFDFTPINMDALTAQLFDAEFFGHTRGAFTGAEKNVSGTWNMPTGVRCFWMKSGTCPWSCRASYCEFYRTGSLPNWAPVDRKKQMFDLWLQPTKISNK